MDLSTDEFLAALGFVARQGRPALLLTDNGTKFIGSKKKLEDFYHLRSSQPTQESVSQYLLENHIEWSHSPARSPHFGGIWEAGVKQM